MDCVNDFMAGTDGYMYIVLRPAIDAPQSRKPRSVTLSYAPEYGEGLAFFQAMTQN